MESEDEVEDRRSIRDIWYQPYFKLFLSVIKYTGHWPLVLSLIFRKIYMSNIVMGRIWVGLCSASNGGIDEVYL